MAEIEKHYIDIANAMGFTLEKDPYSVGFEQPFMIQHQHTGARISLEKSTVEALLTFLDRCRFRTTDQTLEDRVAKLEGAVFGSVKNDTGAGAANSSVEPNLKEMKIRAQAIGTKISGTTGDSEYHYHRPRFLIPGTRYQFYFTMDNAFNPKQGHYSGPIFVFDKSDLPLLEKWLEHDEQIYDEYNEKYSVGKQSLDNERG